MSFTLDNIRDESLQASFLLRFGLDRRPLLLRNSGSDPFRILDPYQLSQAADSTPPEPEQAFSGILQGLSLRRDTAGPSRRIHNRFRPCDSGYCRTAVALNASDQYP